MNFNLYKQTDSIRQLNKDEFLFYAARCYSNPRCISISEFHEDVNRFKHVKKLLKRYHTYGIDSLQERLICNHLVIIANMFTIEHSVDLLFSYMPREYWSALKPFLLFLNCIHPEDFGDIEIDLSVVDKIKNL